MLASNGEIDAIKIVRCAYYPSLAGALKQYLDEKDVKIQSVHLAVAGIADDEIDTQSFLNLPTWNFSKLALKNSLGLEKLTVINDSTAIALAILHLTAGSLKSART